MGHSGLLSREGVHLNRFPSNWLTLTTTFKIGFALFALGEGLPPQWSKIEPLFDGSEKIAPESDDEESAARDAMHGKSYNGDLVVDEDAPKQTYGDGEDNGDDDEDDESSYPKLWPGYPGSCKVPYAISDELNSSAEAITFAMEQYHNQTCIRFFERTDEKDYVQIFKGEGCNSNIGRKGGEQKLSLGDGCIYPGAIVHELGHAIGMNHEHQRKDRNDYIHVFPRHVQKHYGQNFDRVKHDRNLTSFDIYSIMIYGEYAFSDNPDKLKTMEDKSHEVTLKDPYTKPGLANTDIDHVNLLYKCP